MAAARRCVEDKPSRRPIEIWHGAIVRMFNADFLYWWERQTVLTKLLSSRFDFHATVISTRCPAL
jgi:hypothetical protein